VNTVKAQKEVVALIQKLQVWMKRGEKRNLANFLLIEETIIPENERHVIAPDVIMNLQQLSISCQGYSSVEDVDVDVTKKWVLDQFTYELDLVEDSRLIKDDLTEIRASG
jgi:hypothetical protein